MSFTFAAEPWETAAAALVQPGYLYDRTLSHEPSGARS